MYKTVRHGDNSLQYTILPQDATGDAIKHTTSSGKTAVLVAICVVLVGGIVAAVIVPLLVSTKLVLHKQAPLTLTTSTSVPSTPTPTSTTTTISTTLAPTTQPPTTQPTSTLPPSTTQPPTTLAPSTFQPSTSAPASTPILSTISTPTVTSKPPHKTWLPSRWPFVDPANTYAQWTELARQSALVPAACLGALLLAVVIALAACLVTRRRRQKANRRRTIGKMSCELQQGDKTTLLTEPTSETDD